MTRAGEGLFISSSLLALPGVNQSTSSAYQLTNSGFSKTTFITTMCPHIPRIYLMDALVPAQSLGQRATRRGSPALREARSGTGRESPSHFQPASVLPRYSSPLPPPQVKYLIHARLMLNADHRPPGPTLPEISFCDFSPHPRTLLEGQGNTEALQAPGHLPLLSTLRASCPGDFRLANPQATGPLPAHSSEISRAICESVSAAANKAYLAPERRSHRVYLILGVSGNQEPFRVVPYAIKQSRIPIAAPVTPVYRPVVQVFFGLEGLKPVTRAQ